MASVIDICNKALDKVGQSPIISLEDGTKAANLCSRNWPLIRDQVLRDHPWNFATRRATLAPSSTVPDWGFTASFPLPSACLRVTEVLDLSTSDYQIEGRAILADATVLYIRYVERITDPNVYDASFIDSAATRLAAEMCEALTQNNKKKEMLFSEYDASLTAAKRVDGQENPPVPFEEDEWITARF